jgi:GTP pyrophosphokinase
MNEDRLAEALAWATELHRGQTRKGAPVPYVTHLMSVASLVADHGGTEDEVVGALLHDAVEDVGGHLRPEMARRFGEAVVALVDGCSDADGPRKAPWRERKEAFVERLREASPSVRLVVAADKIHNATCLARDLRAEGDAVWGRFRGGRDGTLWYYGAVRDGLAQGWTHPILAELDDALGRLRVAAESARKA